MQSTVLQGESQISGAGYSKLTTLLVNVSLKFQTLISEICQYFLLKKCENANIFFFLKKYRKNSKNWDTLNYHRDCPTNGIVGFYSAILRSKDADRITNRVDTDQTAPRGAVRSGSALFAQTYLSQYFKLLRYEKLLQCKLFSYFFSTKHINVFGYKVIKYLMS